MRIVIIANGVPPTDLEVSYWFRSGDTLCCADGGARVALQLHIRPTMVVGDFDSLGSTELAQLQQLGTELIQHPREKEETDLELALMWAVTQGPDEIIILGALGGRSDQMLANIMLLALPQLQHVSVRIVSECERLILLQPTVRNIISGSVGDTISLLPIGGDVDAITTEGLQYPLHGESLRFGPARGVSNVLVAREASVCYSSGRLLCIHSVTSGAE